MTLSERSFYPPHAETDLSPTSHPCALARLDPLQLAWAAGFFDGEGSTFVSARKDRPEYLRLEVSVGQSGHTGSPEVLYRFQAAVLGIGTISGPDGDDMYMWRANGLEEAQATVALLWRQLGLVKRAQATAALRSAWRQYATGRYVARPPRRKRPKHWEHTAVASSHVAQELDLAWAAGFLDGEGHFGLPRAGARKGAPDWHRIRVSATQNGQPGMPPEVLLKLHRLLGGSIEIHGEPDDFRWLMEGPERVEGVYLKLRPWLGTVKQEQARSVIHGFRAQTRIHGDATRCARGHDYSRVYMSIAGPRRKCSACERILARMKRAAQGIKPRQFKNVARRYTF